MRFVEIATTLLDIVSPNTKAAEGNVSITAERHPMSDCDAVTSYRYPAEYENPSRQPVWEVLGFEAASSCRAALLEPGCALRTESAMESHIAQHLTQMSYSLVSRLDRGPFPTKSMRSNHGPATGIDHADPERSLAGPTSSDAATAAERYMALLIRSGDDASYHEFAKTFVRESAQRLDELTVNVRQDLQTTSSDEEPPTEAKIVEDLATQLVPYVKNGVENRLGYAKLSDELDSKLDKIIDDYHRLVIAAAN